MIKVSFQFDSGNQTATDFYNWLAAMPLNKNTLRLRTAIDCVDPSTGAAQHIGNVTIEGNTGSQGATFEVKVPDNTAARPTSFHQTNRDIEATGPTSAKPAKIFSSMAAPAPAPLRSSFDAGDMGMGSDMGDFGSDLDDFLLNEILFGDGAANIDLPYQDSEENVSQIQASGSNVNVAVVSPPEPKESIQETVAQSVSGEADDSTLDFLFGSLDSFNM